MKLFNIALGVSLTSAREPWKKGGKREGKHGRTLVPTNDRWIWDHPLCITVPTHASCDNNCKGDFTNESGMIRIKPEDYKDYQSCLWTIKVPENKKLMLRFDKKAGFNVEYHHKCGYDRIHIFSGSITGEQKRHARFCGPKNGEKPYDGSGKVKETDGKMPFWDVPYDLGSNQAIIGFDVDQKFVGGGFTLRWNSVESYDFDFTNVYDGHRYLDDALREQMKSIIFPKDKLKSKYNKKVNNLLDKSLDAIKNNRAGSGKRKRKCAKPENQSVTPEVVQEIKDVYDSGASFDDTVAAMISLLQEFLGECNNARSSWPRRLEKLMNQLAADRCPAGDDCRV